MALLPSPLIWTLQSWTEFVFMNTAPCPLAFRSPLFASIPCPGLMLAAQLVSVSTTTAPQLTASASHPRSAAPVPPFTLRIPGVLSTRHARLGTLIAVAPSPPVRLQVAPSFTSNVKVTPERAVTGARPARRLASIVRLVETCIVQLQFASMAAMPSISLPEMS